MGTKTWRLKKRPTGIVGLDQLTGGGLPESQATMVMGGPGSGKTVLCLQIMAHAMAHDQGGVFVSFEESPEQWLRNADSFDWGKSLFDHPAWSELDARQMVDATVSGGFDLTGLIVAIGAKLQGKQAPWVIIDGIDQLLKRHPSVTESVDQLRQLNEHCEANGWTLLLSGKLQGEAASPVSLAGLEFMLPTVITLSTDVVKGRMSRFLRVAKYRGSAHVGDAVGMLIDDAGIQLPLIRRTDKTLPQALTDRISTGVEELDTILCGGVYRGSSLLVSGRPGTAKSTIAAGLAASVSKQGSRVLVVSFDELQSAYVRNLRSVGIELQPLIDDGRMQFLSLVASERLVIEHLLTIKRALATFKPDCLVIDPVSAFLKAPGVVAAEEAVEHLVHHVRNTGITLVMTSLIGDVDREAEATLGQVSSIADTWIVLDFNVRAGERNRALSVVKSRGTAHSNQQREMLLSGSGITLAPVYEYGTEVLMGTARLKKKRDEQEAARRHALEFARRRAEIEENIERVQREAHRLRTELTLHEQQLDAEAKDDLQKLEDVIRWRSANKEGGQ